MLSLQNSKSKNRITPAHLVIFEDITPFFFCTTNQKLVNICSYVDASMLELSVHEEYSYLCVMRMATFVIIQDIYIAFRKKIAIFTSLGGFSGCVFG